MVYCFFPATPPEKSMSKGSKGAQHGMMLGFKDNPHQFALGLKDAACVEPACCILSGCGAGCGLTACWARKAVLEKYHKGVEDYVCCQGYIPRCCCIEFGTMCKGQMAGLICEGCCFPVFSLSIARIHLMDSKQVRPDPVDWQLIQCSNFLQLISCLFDIAAAFFEPLKEAATILDLIADLFTLSVAGCMGAQIHHEIKKDADGVVFVVVEGVPVGDAQVVVGGSGLAAQDAQASPTAVKPGAGAPDVNEMVR